MNGPALGTEPPTGVADLDHQSLRCRAYRHRHLLCGGVLGRIRQRLADDDVRHAQEVLGHVVQIAFDGDLGREPPPLHHIVDVFGQWLLELEACLLVLGKPVEDLPELGQRLADLCAGPCQAEGGLLRVTLDLVPQRFQLEHGSGHRLGQAVVDLVRPAMTLSLHTRLDASVVRLDHRSGAPHHLRRHPHGLGRQARSVLPPRDQRFLGRALMSEGRPQMSARGSQHEAELPGARVVECPPGRQRPQGASDIHGDPRRPVRCGSAGHTDVAPSLHEVEDLVGAEGPACRLQEVV